MEYLLGTWQYSRYEGFTGEQDRHIPALGNLGSNEKREANKQYGTNENYEGGIHFNSFNRML